MNQDRIQKLREYLKETPDDPFLLYALAEEYKNNDPGKAREYYLELLAKNPDYLPTYYQAASLFYEIGNTQKAKALFEKGMQLAKSQNETHTYKELNQAYNELLDEE